jgi:hypothetical protein
METKDCECTAILLQDIGPVGLDGTPFLRQVLGDHKIISHYSKFNKSRTVAIIIHKNWEIRSIYREESGSVIGVVIAREKVELLLISAYLPAMLEVHGIPRNWDATSNRESARIQEEAHASV